MTRHMQPFFQAMQDLIRGDLPEPAPAPAVVRHSCRYCVQGGRDDGGLCMHCDGHGNPEPPEPDDDGEDISLEQALRNMGIG